MFVTNWISTTKIQKISEITNFFRHYFLSRTEVNFKCSSEKACILHKHNMIIVISRIMSYSFKGSPYRVFIITYFYFVRLTRNILLTIFNIICSIIIIQLHR